MSFMEHIVRSSSSDVLLDFHETPGGHFRCPSSFSFSSSSSSFSPSTSIYLFGCSFFFYIIIIIIYYGGGMKRNRWIKFRWSSTGTRRLICCSFQPWKRRNPDVTPRSQKTFSLRLRQFPFGGVADVNSFSITKSMMQLGVLRSIHFWNNCNVPYCQFVIPIKKMLILIKYLKQRLYWINFNLIYSITTFTL